MKNRPTQPASRKSVNAAIGLIDSGLGGLTVAAEIRHLLPAESLLLIADSAWAPYGEKSADEIIDRCDQLSQLLISKDCKAIVIACNTATAAAATTLRERYTLPIIGMEPAVKPAAAATRNGKVGVLATTGTLASARFAGLLGRFAGDIEVITQPCPGLVEQIEHGELDTNKTRALLTEFIEPLKAAGVDTVVLGCTHYPLVKPIIAELMPNVEIIDTGAAVARELQRRLDQAELLATGEGSLLIASSGDAKKAASLASIWLEEKVEAQSIDQA